MKSRLREKREAKEEATFGSAHARPKVAYRKVTTLEEQSATTQYAIPNRSLDRYNTTN